jgi:precorrin-2 dehydrogenase/sirohydrochlorin ferrochelatase
MHVALYIDLTGLEAAVIGGGNVGTRRAVLLLSSGANVTVYSKEFNQKLVDLSKEKRLVLKQLREDTAPEELVDELARKYLLVVIATNDIEFNSKLSRLLMNKGILVNNATKAQEGNTIFPFQTEIDDGRLRLAVTSLGKAGIAARKALEFCKDYLEKDNNYIRYLFVVMSKFKEILIRCIEDPKARLPLYFEVDSDNLFRTLVKEGQLEQALRRALEIAGLSTECLRDPKHESFFHMRK